MTITKDEKNKVIAAVAEYLATAESATRKEIIERVLERYGFSDKERKNKSPGSQYNTIRSYVGTVLTDMSAHGSIAKRNDTYCLAREKKIVVREDACKNAITELLRKKPYTKKELYAALQNRFKTDTTRTTDDDNALKGLAGNLLSDLLADGKVVLTADKYALAADGASKTYPKRAVSEEVFERLFIERITDAGGAFFEKFAANLLEKYYTINGANVRDCEIIGGSADGGIDAIIDLVDDFGFAERIMVQAKCRKNAQVAEKEVREFYGALHANGGTKGIFITTSAFHVGAEKLLASVKNCVGVDGHKIFELAKKTAYGIRKNKDGYLFDETIFRA